MSTLTARHFTQHFVSSDKFETSMDRVFSALWRAMGKTLEDRSTPILVGIEVNYNRVPNASTIVRNFLKRFRTFHGRHFVRFVTDTLWAMESDNGDIFYTHDGPKKSVCDVVWDLKVINSHQLEIDSYNHINIQRRDLTTAISKSLRRFQILDGTKRDTADITQMVGNFYKNTKHADKLFGLSKNFRLLFVPNQCNTGFYPILMPRITEADAIRKGRALEHELCRGFVDLYEILRDPMNSCDACCRVIELIQDNPNFGVDLKVSHDVYGLAESLLAAYTMQFGLSDQNQEILVFNRCAPNRLIVHDYSLKSLAGVI